MTKVLITGPSGAGKSTLAWELSRRRYAAYSTDDVPGLTHHHDTLTGQVMTSTPPAPIDFSRYLWNWDVAKLKQLLDSADPVFVAGWTGNTDENLHLFDHVFALVPSPEIAGQRVLSRPDSVNDFGKHPDELADILSDIEISKDYWTSRGATIIDADQPIRQVADDILARINLKEAAL